MIRKILTISDYHGQQYVEDARDAWLRNSFVLESIGIDAALDETELKNFIMIAITLGQTNSPLFQAYVRFLRFRTNTPIVLFPYDDYAKEEAVTSLCEGAAQMISLPTDMEDAILNCIALIDFHVKTNAAGTHITLYADYKIILDLERYCVYVDGKEIDLSKTEFEILRFLMEHRGIYLSHSQIYSHVWGDEYFDSPHYIIHNKIINLRKKMQWKDNLPQFIRTKRGVGYSFAPQHDQKGA